MSAPDGCADSSDAPIRPAARPPWSWRGGRRFRGSARCGRVLGVQAFSRLRCWIGDSAQSITTVRCHGRQSARRLLDLALAEIGRSLIWLTGAINASAIVRSMARASPRPPRAAPRHCAGHADPPAPRDHRGAYADKADDITRPLALTPPAADGRLPFSTSGFQSDHSQAGASSRLRTTGSERPA